MKDFNLTNDELVGAAMEMKAAKHPTNEKLGTLTVKFVAARPLIPILAMGIRLMLESMPGTSRVEAVSEGSFNNEATDLVASGADAIEAYAEAGENIPTTVN